MHEGVLFNVFIRRCLLYSPAVDLLYSHQQLLIDWLRVKFSNSKRKKKSKCNEKLAQFTRNIVGIGTFSNTHTVIHICTYLCHLCYHNRKFLWLTYWYFFIVNPLALRKIFHAIYIFLNIFIYLSINYVSI